MCRFTGYSICDGDKERCESQQLATNPSRPPLSGFLTNTTTRTTHNDFNHRFGTMAEKHLRGFLHMQDAEETRYYRRVPKDQGWSGVVCRGNWTATLTPFGLPRYSGWRKTVATMGKSRRDTSSSSFYWFTLCNLYFVLTPESPPPHNSTHKTKGPHLQRN